MLKLKVLILELGSVDRLATSAVPGGEITPLAHEVVDHAVELGALEVKRLSRLSDALLTCSEV